MDALAMGGVVAAVCRMPRAYRYVAERRGAVLLVGVLILVCGAALSRGYTFSSPMTLSFGYLALAVSIALFITYLASSDGTDHNWRSSLLRHPTMQRIARYSYGMYLLHVPLEFMLRSAVYSLLGISVSQDIGLASDLAYIATMWMITYAVAALSYRHFESRFRRLKVRFRPLSVRVQEPVAS
jgi:peptidoglycan/LPS O-acetylase OafA/YrhL